MFFYDLNILFFKTDKKTKTEIKTAFSKILEIERNK